MLNADLLGEKIEIGGCGPGDVDLELCRSSSSVACSCSALCVRLTQPCNLSIKRKVINLCQLLSMTSCLVGVRKIIQQNFYRVLRSFQT